VPFFKNLPSLGLDRFNLPVFNLTAVYCDQPLCDFPMNVVCPQRRKSLFTYHEVNFVSLLILDAERYCGIGLKGLALFVGKFRRYASQYNTTDGMPTIFSSVRTLSSTDVWIRPAE